MVKILTGEQPGAIPVRVAAGSDLYVNKTMAARLGLEIPHSVLERTTKVIQ